IATEEALGETGTEAYPESITPATGESGIAGVAQSVDVPQAYSLEPGNKIRVPYLAGFKGKVTTIHARGNTLWVGTEYGVLRFSQSGWSVPGYKDHVVEEGQTLDDIAALKGESNPDHLAAYKSALVDINDLDGAPLVAGEMLKVYRNPAAAHTFKIMSHQEATYFATGDGLFMFDGQVFNRVPLGGMQYANAVDIQNVNGELWFGGSSRIVVRATGRSELSMMYVKWLPDLADDLYYAYLSGVFGIGDLGTFGLSTSFISYGTITRTKNDPTPVGTFESFDVAVAGSYGTSLTNKLKGGITAKIIYSKLSDQGAGSEKGKGTSTGFGVDLGLMYLATDRLKFGMAVTNLGPNMTYINAAQSDPLPRNLGLGFSYKLLQSDYYYLLTTAEVNKLLVGLNDGVSEEIKQVVYNGGAEFMYANIFAVRAGYIFDEEGKIKSPTFGAGISPANLLKFDFAYIPSGTSSPLANTLRVSMSFLP
ncbi:MAG: PorV/PorQ family protein, partial [Candidatus Zixiibacteriota bacterium]